MHLLKKDRLEHWQAGAGLAFKIAVAAGGLLMMAYCMGEGILPESVSLGDGLFLVWCLISFGFVTIVGTFYGAAASLWIVSIFLMIGNAIQRLRAKPQAAFVEHLRSGPIIFAASPVCFILFVLVAISTDARSDIRLAETIGFFILFGGFLVMAFGVIPVDGKKIPWRLGVLIVGGALVMAAVGTRPALLNVTMSMLGVRSLPGEAVVIAESERNRISSFAKLYGIDLSICELPGTGQTAIANAYVVWHAVGATSFIRLAADPKIVDKGIVVPLPRKDVTVIGRDQLAPTCRRN